MEGVEEPSAELDDHMCAFSELGLLHEVSEPVDVGVHGLGLLLVVEVGLEADERCLGLSYREEFRAESRVECLLVGPFVSAVLGVVCDGVIPPGSRSAICHVREDPSDLVICRGEGIALELQVEVAGVEERFACLASAVEDSRDVDLERWGSERRRRASGRRGTSGERFQLFNSGFELRILDAKGKEGGFQALRDPSLNPVGEACFGLLLGVTLRRRVGKGGVKLGCPSGCVGADVAEAEWVWCGHTSEWGFGLSREVLGCKHKRVRGWFRGLIFCKGNRKARYPRGRAGDVGENLSLYSQC